jgi:acyl-CoA thioesterase FadM
MVSAPLNHELRVRYGECDPQGVVFNAHYLAHLDIGSSSSFGRRSAATRR